jgi:hypothetical protein
VLKGNEIDFKFIDTQVVEAFEYVFNTNDPILRFNVILQYKRHNGKHSKKFKISDNFIIAVLTYVILDPTVPFANFT